MPTKTRHAARAQQPQQERLDLVVGRVRKRNLFDSRPLATCAKNSCRARRALSSSPATLPDSIVHGRSHRAAS